MAAYDDSSWVRQLEDLGLSEEELMAARELMFNKDANFRQGMLGGRNPAHNKAFITKYLKQGAAGELVH